MDIEILCDVKTRLGEGPLWDAQQQRLYWLDVMSGTIFSCTEGGGELRSWDIPGIIGSIAIRKDGNGAVVALKNSLNLLDFRTGETTKLHDVEANLPGNRLNDGKVDQMGRFVFGSCDMNENEPNGVLYRLDPDLSLHELDHGILVSNGPCWSPDGSTFYFSDTWSGDIWKYDYDLATGAVSNRRTFATLEASQPLVASDGSTVDSEGFLWNAQIFEGDLVRYAPDGTIDRRVPMPVKKVSSVMFGGENLDVLYVTSMATSFKPEYPADPIARGSVFAVRGLGVTGIAEHRFGA